MAAIDDGSEALGAPQVAGTRVSPKSLTKQLTARVAGTQVAGVVGGLVATAATSKAREVPEMPNFLHAYLAASEEKIAIVKMKTGVWQPKMTDEALAVAPRAAIEAITLDKGYVSKLKIEFAEDRLWQFEIPRVFRSSALEFVKVLGGTID